MSFSSSNNNNSDKAARAYAAIKAQLSQFDDNDNNYNNNSYHNDESTIMDIDHTMNQFSTLTQNQLLSSSKKKNMVVDDDNSEQKINYEDNTNSHNVDNNNNNNFGHDDDDMMDEYNDYNNIDNDNFMNMPNSESLDGDYRPYYEAITAFLNNSNNNNGNNNNEINKRLKATQLQFMNRLMRSNYDRSTLLQQNDDDMEYVSTTRHLENEGHFWSLLSYLLDNNDNNNKDTLDFLLWDDDKNKNTNNNMNRMIDHFINDVVNENTTVDPASMVHIIQSYFEDEDNDDHHNNNNISLPSIVKRRQIILSWIESCHNRSMINGHDHYNTIQNKTKDSNNHNIMWKDTLSAFKKNLNTSMNKITSFHPDAPMIFKMKQSSNLRNVDPLYGNDGSNETYLLSTCLSLMKAGRFNDALECCRDFGQPWRTAVWDGNGPHGYQNVIEYNEDDDIVGTDKDNNTKRIRIGNPQRSLWKRSVWKASEAMNSLLISKATNDTTGGSNHQSKQMIASGSLVYEAAITSILADDVTTALMNPILKNHWMDLVWVYYRGKQSRFMEEVYCFHNAARRSLARTSSPKDNLLEGTEYEEEEKEQLVCTADVKNTNDAFFLSELDTECANRAGTDDQDLFWRPGMCSFLSSLERVENYLIGVMKSLLENAAEAEKLQDDTYFTADDDVMLRFLYHLIFLLETLISDNEDLGEFRDNVIMSFHDDLLQLYIKRLTRHKSLWKYTCSYASLLPLDDMIDTLTNFWMTSIHDDQSRRVIVTQARECLSTGLDLDILRKVVRGRISMVPTEGGSTLLKSFPSALMKGTNGTIDKKISQDDLQKMHSIQWLCMYNEHFADALVCVNMLLRQFLLQVDQENNDGEIRDWVDDVKLRAAMIFKNKFLSHDFIDKAMNGGGIDGGENIDEDGSNKMSPGELEDSLKEFQSIGSFFEAHSAYVAWKEAILSLPAEVDFHSEANFTEGTLESEISMKMDKRNYINKKRKNALALIKVADVAHNKMVDLMTSEGGFLNSKSELGVHSLGEVRERTAQLKTLQSKCLQHMFFLTYSVLTETAKWMNEFVEDIRRLFQDEALDILSRIHMIQDEDDELDYPFLPETWHTKASKIFDIINENIQVTKSFGTDEIEYLQSLMSETDKYLEECRGRVM